MTATATLIDGPGVVPGLGLISTWKVLLDSSFVTTGEPIDLTSVYSEISAASVAGADALADHGYKFDVVLPADGTAITSTTVLIAGHWSPAVDGDADVHKVFEALDGDDLASVGELRLIVIGKAIT